MVDKYVLAKYLDCPDAEARSPPAVRTNSKKRPYTVVSAEAAWNVLEKARKARISGMQVLLVKDDDPTCTENKFQADRWMRKEVLMYFDRMQLPFVDQGT